MTISGLRALQRRIIATQQGTTTERNLRRYFDGFGVDYKFRTYASPQKALQAYASSECNLYALDLIPLTGERLRLPDPQAHIILDDFISKEAMGPVVSAADYGWIRSVTWIMRVLIEAEELGLNSNNCMHLPSESMQHINDFLHPTQDKQDRLELMKSFPQIILQEVGNYAEIFNKNLGNSSSLLLPRALNALWSQGGLLISPSFQ